MAVARIASTLAEVEDGKARVGMSREAVPIQQFAIDGREEALA